MFRTPTFILRQRLATSVAALLLVCGLTAQAQTSSFTYQGRLTDGAMPANGAYEMEFKLYDALTGGAQQPQPTPVTIALTDANSNAVLVTNGVFTVQLDFGADAFPGAERYLQISVRRSGDISLTVLSRQQISSTPYAIRSSSAATADNATNLENVLRGTGTLNNPENPVDWTLLKNVPAAAASSYTAGPGISIIGQTISNTGVRTVGATFPLSSTGGQNSIITLSGVVPVSSGGTGSRTQNFVDLSTDQTITGTKTFSTIVAGSFSPSGMGQISRYDPALVATLRWDLLPLGYGDFAIGNGPGGMAFDGTNIWVANSNGDNVTKLRASDGTFLGTFPVGDGPTAMAFDGANIWVANTLGNNVTKLLASNGAFLGNFPVGRGPTGVAFDGTNVWVANSLNKSATRLRASDGARVGTVSLESDPRQVTFDGANIWVTLGPAFPAFQTRVRRIRASDGATEAADAFPVGLNPHGVAFDGTNIWVANVTDNTVTKRRASDGALLGTFAAGPSPKAIAYDGTYIWVTNSGNEVTKVRASDGANMGTVKVGVNPSNLLFDGTNIWVTSPLSNTVSKR